MNILEKNIRSQKEEKAQHYTDVLKSGNAYIVRMNDPYSHIKGLFFKRVSNQIRVNKAVILGLATQGSYTIHTQIDPISIAFDNHIISQTEIEDAIKEANSIVELPADWDGEGALQITKGVFEAAVGFLREYSCYISDNFHIQIEAPEINPVRNGSIDLEWHTTNAQMLINIRHRDNEFYAYYYGDRYQNRMPIKGNVPLSEFSESLAVWMKYLV